VLIKCKLSDRNWNNVSPPHKKTYFQHKKTAFGTVNLRNKTGPARTRKLYSLAHITPLSVSWLLSRFITEQAEGRKQSVQSWGAEAAPEQEKIAVAAAPTPSLPLPLRFVRSIFPTILPSPPALPVYPWIGCSRTEP
jgi:hypothetical protein